MSLKTKATNVDKYKCHSLKLSYSIKNVSKVTNTQALVGLQYHVTTMTTRVALAHICHKTTRSEWCVENHTSHNHNEQKKMFETMLFTNF